METAVLNIASIPAILALVQLGKSFGIKGKWATLLAVALGVVLNVAVVFYGNEPWFIAVAAGLILGLSAAGLYDIAKTAAPNAAPPITEPTPELVPADASVGLDEIPSIDNSTYIARHTDPESTQ